MTNWADITNGVYELVAGGFLAMSCVKLYHDKEVRGWSISTQLFFTSWGYWNLFYYSHLNQWASWMGGISVVIFNSTWTILAIYYSKKNKKLKQLADAYDEPIDINVKSKL